jgi:hypothetical protein
VTAFSDGGIVVLEMLCYTRNAMLAQNLLMPSAGPIHRVRGIVARPDFVGARALDATPP